MKHEINVPEGCKVVSVETTNEMVVVKFEKDEPEFKENDIVYTEHVWYGRVSILKNSDFSKSSSNGDMFADTKVTMHVKTDFSLTKNENLCFSFIRLATDSEKQLLFDKLKEKCLMFDGENIVRWRAEPYQKYFYLSGDGRVSEVEQYLSNWDNNAYSIGNYFPTREIAEAFQKQYLELLINFHKNL